MSFLYIWRPAGQARAEAGRHFALAVERQARLYERALERPFAAYVQPVGPIYVGLVAAPPALRGWQSWQPSRRVGLAWSGVCESLLGREPAPGSVEALGHTVAHSPRQAAAWSGRFAVCAWDADAEQVALLTGAEASPTLWQVEGPRGWAAGSRALPLLDLVGRPAAIDPAAAGLFAAYGYLAGEGALFRHVRRIGSRQHLLLTPEHTHGAAYIGLAEYLALEQPARPRAAVAHEEAERLVARVGRQLAASELPQLLLTGGRDSRCIAAAAVAAGYGGTARTSGPPDAADVTIAAQVAGALGIAHEREAAPQRPAPLRAMLDSPERLRLWARLSEGTETIRHALAFQPFFAGDPRALGAEQIFHGLHGLAGDALRLALAGGGASADAPLDRGAARAALLGQAPPQLRGHSLVAGALCETLDQLDGELREIPLSPAQWATLHYWQRRALHWGADAMSVKDTLAWHWTPLLDGGLMRAFFSTRGGTGKELLEAITVAIAPRLRGMPYDKQPDHPLSKLKQRARHALKAAHRRGWPLPPDLARRARVAADPDLPAFWERAFFRSQRAFWPELIDEPALRATIQAQPRAELLWNLATIELAAEGAGDAYALT